MDIIDFKEKKNEKENVFTPKDVLEDISDYIDNIETLIVIYKDNEGLLRCTHSHELITNKIGLLEIAKQMMMEDLRQ